MTNLFLKEDNSRLLMENGNKMIYTASYCEYKIKRIIDNGTTKIVYYSISYLTQIPDKDFYGNDCWKNNRTIVQNGSLEILSSDDIKSKMHSDIMSPYWAGLSSQEKTDNTLESLYPPQIP